MGYSSFRPAGASCGRLPSFVCVMEKDLKLASVKRSGSKTRPILLSIEKQKWYFLSLGWRTAWRIALAAIEFLEMTDGRPVDIGPDSIQSSSGDRPPAGITSPRTRSSSFISSSLKNFPQKHLNNVPELFHLSCHESTYSRLQQIARFRLESMFR